MNFLLLRFSRETAISMIGIKTMIMITKTNIMDLLWSRTRSIIMTLTETAASAFKSFCLLACLQACDLLIMMQMVMKC